jgi:hypothetical protein
MERSRVSRYLRIAVTAVSLTACFLLVALWVRSYWRIDSVRIPIPGSKFSAFSAVPGNVQWGIYNDSDFPPESRGWYFLTRSVSDDIDAMRLGGIREIKFRSGFGLTPAGAHVPYWFLIVLTATLTLLILLVRRFSLRTLLISTTLVAVGMGVVIYLAR